MARLFDDGNSEYLSRSDTLGISAYPFTFACWFNSDAALNQTLMSFGSIAQARHQELRLRDPADSDVIMLTYTGGNAFAATSNQWSTNTWHHACGIVAGDADRSVFLDGGGKGTDATSQTFSGVYDRTAIGVRISNNVFAQYMSGNIAEAAVWDVALTDTEVAILAAGYSPLFVRPQNLVAYWPLVRDNDNDIVGGYSLTPTNTPSISAHPRVIYPVSSRTHEYAVAAAGGGEVVKIMLQHGLGL